MERRIVIKKLVKEPGAADGGGRRERRVEVIRKAGAGEACSVTCVCEPADSCVAWCGSDGEPCVCLCGCEAAEITEEAREGHTLITIRVPSATTIAGTEDPLVKAAGVTDAVEHLAAGVGRLVRDARANGSSWTEIGAALGISKQAAWERFSGEE